MHQEASEVAAVQGWQAIRLARVPNAAQLRPAGANALAHFVVSDVEALVPIAGVLVVLDAGDPLLP